jgi:glycosyltransferase involved in cell wall biosynthesis
MTPPTPINKASISTKDIKKDKIAIVVTTVTVVYCFLRPHLNKLSELYDVTLLLKNDAPELLSEMALPVRIIEVPIERKIKIIADIKTVIKMFVIFRRECFKSVHTITPKAGLLGNTASFLARTPIRIHTFQGEVWTNTSGFVRKFFIFLDKIVALLATNITVVSHSERDFLIKEKILKNGQAKVLGAGTIGGIDLDRFSSKPEQKQLARSRAGYIDNDIVFAYVGRLNTDKGLNILTDAFYSLFPNHNNARLLIIGPDEDGTGEKLKYFSSQFASGVVIILPFMKNPETSLILADVLVLPSFREGFGLVIMEAAAMGIPAIGSNIYGISDAIQDGKTGLLFTVRDSNDLCIKMKNMIIQNEKRKKLGVCAYERVARSFSQDIILDHFIEYYRSLPFEQY